MNDSLNALNRLLQEIAEHLKAGTPADKSAAAAKLQQLSTQAVTLALMIKRKT